MKKNAFILVAIIALSFSGAAYCGNSSQAGEKGRQDSVSMFESVLALLRSNVEQSPGRAVQAEQRERTASSEVRQNAKLETAEPPRQVLNGLSPESLRDYQNAQLRQLING